MRKRDIVGVPRVPSGMVARTALLDRLGQSPLTVIRAPGGSGKTVLMAQWASRQRASGAWVTVEADIGNRLSFWTAAVEAVSRFGQVPRLPAEDGADRDALRVALIRTFGAIDEPVILIIDDAHELRDPLVAEDLLALLRACPSVTAIVGTRIRSELEAPRQTLSLDITVVEPDEMVLSSQDVHRIVGELGSPYGSTVELLEASGGSPLLLRAILAGSSAGIGVESSAQAVVSDLLRGLFQRHSELEAFASATSIPDDVDVASGQHLSGLPADRVESLLAALEIDGLVMRRDSYGTPRYKYHPLVREVLRDELRKHDVEQFRHASLLASADAEARKHFIPALRHAVEAEDYTRASDVCLHGGFTLLRSRGAAAILQQVPLRYVARLPFLAVVLGLAANAQGERLKAIELLTLAMGASRAWRKSQRIAERAGLALVETVVLRVTGRADDAATAARRLLRILDEAPPAELEEIADQLDAYRNQAAHSLFRAGKLSEARTAAERVGISAHALNRGGPDALAAASLVAMVDAATGANTAAATTLALIDAGGFDQELIDGYVGTLAHLARGVLALERGDVDSAQREADLLRGRPNLEHGMLFTALWAYIALFRGTPENGLGVLKEREATDRPRARLSGQDRQVVATVRVLLNAAAGQTGAAHAALRGLERTDPVATILHATLLLQAQRPELAVERLGTQTEWRSPRLQAAADLLMCCASLRRGDESVAETALRRFLATSTVHGTWSPAVLVPAADRPGLWDFAARMGVEDAVVDRLREMPAPFVSGTKRVTLTRREVEVLDKLRATASLAEIAATLSVSGNTVKSQVRTLYRKLEVSNREDALREAYLLGLLGE